MQKRSREHSRALWISEVSSYVIGLSLLLYAFVAWANGQIDNQLATRSFMAQKSGVETVIAQETSVKENGAVQSSADVSYEVDFASWSEKRIVAWRAALSEKGPDAFAMLSVPSAGISVPVFEGADERNLNAGAAWIEGTDKPGFDYGNTGIAGHRDGFFRGLRNVKIGEPILLLAGGEELVYRISDISIVEPTNIEVLLPQQEELITLVTCYPFYFVGHAPQRYIVQAVRER